MKKIKIDITKAQLINFSVSLNEDKPEVSATIQLLTKNNKKISQYSIFTNSYDNAFELPFEMIKPIKDIMNSLEVIVVRHCNQGQKQLN